MHDDVPLVVPEINCHLIKTCLNRIIANLNCSTAILCMCLYPILKLSPILRADISTYQAVSGAEQVDLDELKLQTKQSTNKQRPNSSFRVWFANSKQLFFTQQ